jgi:hypothetical protein
MKHPPYAFVIAFALSPLLGQSKAAEPSPFARQTIPAGISPATERAADYETALARGKATGKDIVVFQRGSDWNLCAETLYQTVWSTDAFVKALGDGFVLVAVDNPESPGAPPVVVGKSQGDQHVAGGIRAAVLNDKQTEEHVRAVAAAQQAQSRNRRFTWFDGGHCPRLALMDAQGRAVAADNRPRIELTSQTMAELIRAMRAKRTRRDELWSKAEAARGPEKAELLRQSLDVLGFGGDEAFGRFNGWAGPNGNDQHYAFVHAAMRQADPKDESGAVRWLGFGLGAWGGVGWAAENQWWKKLEGKKELTDADYAEALDCIDRELKDPRNRLLKTEHIQHIMQARYDLYLRKLQGKHDDEVLFQIQREIAALDPTTFWGIGATGYLAMYHRTVNPYLTYGWEGARQLRTGVNVWQIADTAYYLDHAGLYKLAMTCNAGTDSLKVKRVALLDGATVLAEARPAAGKDQVAPGKPVEVLLDCGGWHEGRGYVLQIEYEAAEGHRNNNGVFSVEPLLADE